MSHDFANAWNWLTKTDAGLAARIAAGAAIFLLLALVDLRRRGPRATRWREYLFLLSAIAIALIYGVANDLITSRLSWEYFYYGKDLAPILGDRTPPDPQLLAWEAAKVGLKATWTVGLVIGVAVLLANNPSRARPQLSYRALLRRMPLIIATSILCAALLGTIGYLGGLAPLSDDFREMLRHDEFRPHRFMAVYGIHLGGYIGGAIGTVLAILSIRKRRRSDITTAFASAANQS
jgi:hypothetical protein